MAASRLRQILADQGTMVVCPGVYDGLTARIALASGYEVLYMTGAGTTASRLGQPDLGVVTLPEMRETASMIAGLDKSIPLIADADTGFGGSLMVHRTVIEYIRAGVAALHLEDQATSKRCGHLLHKQLVTKDEFLSRIKAAVNARQSSGSDIVLIARTDSLATLGYDQAVSRLNAAINLGADVAFLEGISSKEQARRACEDLSPTPVLFNAVTGGVSPELSVEEAKALGFRLMIFPGFALGPVHKAVSEAARHLKENGRLIMSGAGGPKDFFNIVGLEDALAIDAASGENLFQQGV